MWTWPLFVVSSNILRLLMMNHSLFALFWDSAVTWWQHREAASCDYSLQRHFQKSASLLAQPGALALLRFISFGVFNVTQHGIMEKGNLKAPPPPAGWPSHALLLSRGPNPVCLSVPQKMHLQLSELKEGSQHIFFYFCCVSVTTLFFSLFLSFNVS